MSPRRPTTPAYWYGDRQPPMHARALSAVYGRVVAARAKLYRSGLLRRHRVAAPVLVVGNLVAGGSGKTPLVMAIVERLRAAGWAPGVASRGHGRAEAATPRWVDANTDPRLAGDEPALISRETGAPVRVDRDRVAAARALVGKGCDVVVCDDGLQHTRLVRDVEIEVIDGRRRYGNGRLLPAGPLREPAERGRHCDFRVLNVGTDADLAPGFGEWPMALRATQALPLAGGRPWPISAFAGKRVHAVAGIGDPERFFAMLRALDIAVVPHAFPDHHPYVAADLQFGSDLPVLMTAKDAVKCASFAGERGFVVPVDAALPEAFWVALLERLRGAREGLA
jgi:tetraacyldisaccharide 4'-kinase